MTSYAPAANRYHEGWIGEAQPHYAQVIAQDAYGNWQWQTVGPIYADVATTPDYISDLKYHGWMESGCSQIGADREIARTAPSHSSLKDAQQLYFSWEMYGVGVAPLYLGRSRLEQRWRSVHLSRHAVRRDDACL